MRIEHGNKDWFPSGLKNEMTLKPGIILPLACLALLF
jgi:hypothetical protein